MVATSRSYNWWDISEFDRVLAESPSQQKLKNLYYLDKIYTRSPIAMHPFLYPYPMYHGLYPTPQPAYTIPQPPSLLQIPEAQETRQYTTVQEKIEVILEVEVEVDNWRPIVLPICDEWDDTQAIKKTLLSSCKIPDWRDKYTSQQHTWCVV